MKNGIRLAGMLVILMTGLLRTQAQSTNTTTLHTNAIFNVSFALTAKIQNHLLAGFKPVTNAVVTNTYSTNLVFTNVVVTNLIDTNIVVTTNDVTNIVVTTNYFTNFVKGLAPVFAETASAGRVTSADVAAIILRALPGTNIPSRATLLLRTTDVGSSNHFSGFFLRSGTNDIDVSSYLNFSFPQQYATVTTATLGPPMSSLTPTNTIDYSVMEFTLNDSFSPNFFDVQGFSILKSATFIDHGRLISAAPFPSSILTTVDGAGRFNGRIAVYHGTVTLSGRRLEVQSVSN